MISRATSRHSPSHMPFCGTGAVETWPAGVGRLIRELETDQTTVFTPSIIVLSSCFASRDVSAALFSPPDDDLPEENPAAGAAAGAPAPPLAVEPSCTLRAPGSQLPRYRRDIAEMRPRFEAHLQVEPALE